ncbi:MAG: peptide deformylase [Chloroflexota bacterium]
MATLPILLFGNPILRRKARRIAQIDGSVQKLIDDMVDTLHDAQGIGLAAPQVGASLRVIVLDSPEQEPLVLINPALVKKRGERTVQEGCLSLPGYRGDIERAVSVTVKGRDREGKEIRVKAEDILAQALEHEIDHLNGILFTDHLDSMEKLYKVEPEKETEMGEVEEAPKAASMAT